MASNWGHKSRRCVYCGDVGPRVIAAGGYAHRRCIPTTSQMLSCRYCGKLHRIGHVCNWAPSAPGDEQTSDQGGENV